MAKNKISEFDVNPDNNTDINSINIAEGCAPSGINNAIRQLMSDLKEFQTGAAGDSFTVGGAFAANGGATLGDASGDALTINSSAVSIPNGLNFDSNTLVIDATNNNVGIGTTSPTTSLEVSKNSNGHGVIINQQNTSSGYYTRLDFVGNNGSGGTNLVASLRAYQSTNGTSGDLRFFTNGSNERMRIDSSGNVGIGTTDTTGIRLGVNSGSASLNTNFNSTNASGVYVRFQNSSTSIGDIGGGGSVISGGTAGDFAMASRSGNLVLGTGSTERMRIDSSGNLLVGTTANIRGARQAILPTTTQHGLSVDIPHPTANQYACITLRRTASLGNFVEIYNQAETAVIGTIATSTNTSVAYNTSSDYRLKENIAPMTGALAKVSALKPVTYTWKSTGEASQGFIAHELAEVVPDCVSGDKDAVDAEGNPKYQGIDTSFLVATLTAAIQEQQAIITDLKARIETLESK